MLGRASKVITGVCLVMLAVAVGGLSTAAAGDIVVFPRDPHVWDAKRDLGTKGDGVADDTAALQKGLDASCGIASKQTKVLYLPNGTYRVTATRVAKGALGPWLYGESRDGGLTEVFGAFVYDPGDLRPDDRRPMFDIENASACLMGIREICFGRQTYPIKVRERRGNDTRTLGTAPGEHGWIGWSLFSGWQPASE